MRFNRDEASAFIHAHVRELRRVAEEAKLETVAYLLGMVELETNPEAFAGAAQPEKAA